MIKRLISAGGVLLTVSVLIFLAMRVVPGDPVTVLTAGAQVSEETKENLRVEYHLNDPLPLQYVHWLGDALQGDLGNSLKHQNGVATLIGKSLPITLLVILGGSLVSLLLSLPLAALAAFREGTKIDRFVVSGSLLVLSIPVFTSSVLAVLIFLFWLGIVPSIGRGSGGFDTFKHLILPCSVLGLSLAAVQTQTFRAGLIDVLSQEYVAGAEMRGITRGRILLQHVTRTALLPVVTLLGLQFGYLMVGTVLIDFVFGLGGIGQLLIDAVQSRDYPLIQGLVMLIAFAFIVGNMLVDVASRLLDPRFQGSS